MQVGLHLSSLSWPGGPPAVPEDLTRGGAATEAQGFTKLSVMDQVADQPDRPTRSGDVRGLRDVGVCAGANRVGRGYYDESQKTVIGPLDPGPRGDHVDESIESLRRLSVPEFTHHHGSVPEAAAIGPIEGLGQRVIPTVAAL